MYLAAVLLRAGIDVEIHNLTNCKSLEEGLATVPQADIYGITVTSIELPLANDFSVMLKEKFPQARIGLGGPGTYTSEYINFDYVDFIYQGEAERNICSVVQKIASGNGQRYYSGGFCHSLDEIPFPARDKLQGRLGGNVFAYGVNYVGEESTVIISSRGCPYWCAFCAAPQATSLNGGLRYRSPENLRDEICSVIDSYGVRQFRFSDDNLTASKSRILELCGILADLEVIWRGSASVKQFDLEIAKAMYAAGCRELSFGIESFDDDVLRLLKKNATVDQNVHALEVCADVGINARVLLMMRTPGQTQKTVALNRQYLQSVPYNMVACTTFVPIPGSDIWEHPQNYGIEIINRNLRDYNFYLFGSEGENDLKPVIRLKDRDTDEVDAETMEFREFLKSTGKLNQG